MAISNMLGFIGQLGLASAMIICIFLILISIFLQIRTVPFLLNFSLILPHLQTLLLGVSLISLAILLEINAFEYAVVFNAVESAMPFVDRLGGLWSGQDSSLLFWSFLMSSAASLATILFKRLKPARNISVVLLVFEITLIFFILPDLFFTNPFQRFWVLPSGTIATAVIKPMEATLFVPLDGLGMNPGLRHISMLIHPPALYLGLIGFFIPYSFTIAALVSGEIQRQWFKSIYSYILLSWVFLSIGMLSGAWWAYTIQGWGGFWGWDAVEISGLLPWLISFGLVRLLILRPHNRSSQNWIILLSIGIVVLTLLGILITRSGILVSVHAYTESSMGPMLTFLIALHLLTILILLVKHGGKLDPVPKWSLKTYSERIECIFNLSLVSLVIIYLYGQTLPISSQLFLGEKKFFYPLDFETYSAPLLILLMVISALTSLSQIKSKDPHRFNLLLNWLLLISAICSFLVLFFTRLTILGFFGFWAVSFQLCSWLFTFFDQLLFPVLSGFWSKSESFFVNEIGLGSFCIHLGLSFMALGIFGVKNFQRTYDVFLQSEEILSVEKFEIHGQFNEKDTSQGSIDRYSFNLLIGSPEGFQSKLMPEIDYFIKRDLYYFKPATKIGTLQDIQVLLRQLPEEKDKNAFLRISFSPLMSCIWIGGGLMVAGALVGTFEIKNQTLFRKVQYRN